MPKRKKLPVVPDYIGMGDPEKLTVQKSTPLQSLAQTDLTLPELKLLDVYLSRIDSHDPEKRTVQIEKGELERVLGVTRILQDDLDTRLRHLFQVIKVKDDTKRRGFKLVSLFEEADAEPDEKTGLWTVTLTCTPSAREYIFNIENLGYLRYRLKNIVELKSRYSYILFMYLENNRSRHRKTWEIGLDELKEMLNCTAETYDRYKYFNDAILKKCHKELNEKTDCHFDYEPVKRGRAIIGVQFTIKSLAELIVEDVAALPEAPMAEDPSRPLWGSALQDWKLSTEQLDELAALVAMVPSRKLPDCQKEDIEKARYQYIAQKAAEIKRRNEEKKIRSRFSYLRKLMQEDIESRQQEVSQAAQAASRGTQAFRNFTERKNNNYMDKILKQYSQT